MILTYSLILCTRIFALKLKAQVKESQITRIIFGEGIVYNRIYMDDMELTNKPDVHYIAGDDGQMTTTVYVTLFFDAIQAIVN